MTTHTFFPTRVYTAALQRAGVTEFNRRLLRECQQIRHDDAAGRKWSSQGYPGGYTSYGSLCRLHTQSPMFEQLACKLDRHVTAFVRELEFDLSGRPLLMTDCWINIMPKSVVHGLHLHPHATLSGTYYVQTPKGAPGLKIEDPRLDRFMAAPPRKSNSRSENRSWVALPATAGTLIMFESWLRHEVVPNQSSGERVSISFNYNWF